MHSLIEHLQNAFHWTWQTSAQASLFVGLVLLLLVIWGRHLSPHWRMALGVLVLVRLMIPILPESSLSYLNLISKNPTPVTDSADSSPEYKSYFTVDQYPLTSQAPNSLPPVSNVSSIAAVDLIPILAANPVIAPVSNSINFETVPSAAESRAFDINSLSHLNLGLIAASFWIIGILSLLFGTFNRRRRLFKQINDQTLLPNDSTPANILNSCRHEMGMDQEVPLIVCPQIQTAAVLGSLRPVILITPELETNYSHGEIRDILLHELSHIQRADIFWNWLAFAAQTLHWFNPLAWIAARRFRADRELACDAHVLKLLSSDERSHYGNTLIKIAALHSNNHFDLNPALAPFNHNKSEIKTRITMIAKPNKINRLTHVMLTLALILVCSITFTRAQEEDKSDKRRKVVAERDGDQKSQAKERDGDRRVPAEKRDSDRGRPHPEKGKKTDAKRDGDRSRSHPEHKGRPPHPPEGRGPKDMPPEAKKFAARVQAFHMEISQLIRAGKREEAHDVTNELKEFIRDHADIARRMGPAIHGPERGREPGRDEAPRENSPEAQLKKLHHALEEAEKGGRREQVEQIRHHIEEIERHHEGRGDRDDDAHHMERRIHHLHVAADNLDEGGLGEAADKIRQQAEDLENEFREQREREAGNHHEERIDHQERQIDLQERQIDKQEEQIDQMRREIEQLKEELRKKGNR